MLMLFSLQLYTVFMIISEYLKIIIIMILKYTFASPHNTDLHHCKKIPDTAPYLLHISLLGQGLIDDGNCKNFIFICNLTII